MVIALGVLGWEPEVFWNATTFEFQAAFEGWSEANGHDPTEPDKTLARDEFEDLKKQFPDDPKPKAQSDGRQG